jgi:hypothetical protein
MREQPLQVVNTESLAPLASEVAPDEIQYPINQFELIEWACDPDTPLEPQDPRYYDFSELRGASVVLEMGELLQQRLPRGSFHKQILCGHKGTGKSTELLQLYCEANQMGYFCVWMDIYEYYGLIKDLDVSDFYLIAAEYLAETLRTQTVIHPPEDRIADIAR